MYKLSLVLLSFFLMTSLVQCAENEQINEFSLVFNFDKSLKNDHSWGFSGNGSASSTQDTASFISSKQSWAFYGWAVNYNGFLYRYIGLPFVADSIEVSIFSKTDDIRGAWLKVWCLDQNDSIVSHDSLSILNLQDWKKFSMKFPAIGTTKVYVEIEFLVNYGEPLKKVLWIDDLQIRALGHNNSDGIDQKGIFGNPSTSSDVIKIDTVAFNGLKKIEDYKKYRIIGLGESIHGSWTIQKHAFEHIKYLIEKESCKLVMLEIPFELGLVLNDYVQNDIDYDIKSKMFMFSYDSQLFYELLCWIKTFNAGNTNKVRVVGIDTNDSNFEGYNHLWDYFKNGPHAPETLNPIFNLLNVGKNFEILDFLLSKSYEKPLPEERREMLIRAINLRKGIYDPKHDLIEGYRDYIQFQNAQFAISRWLKPEEKAVIYAHIGHVNKRNSVFARFYTPSFGNYLDRNYKNEYFVVNFIVGEGFFLGTDSLNATIQQPLLKPIEGSIERYAENLNCPSFYKNVTALHSFTTGRNCGSNFRLKQFFNFSHKGRFDAIVYVQQSRSVEMSSYPITIDEILEFLRKRAELNEN